MLFYKNDKVVSRRIGRADSRLISQATIGGRLTGPRVPDVGMSVIKLFSTRICFYLLGDGNAMKSFERETLFSFH